MMRYYKFILLSIALTLSVTATRAQTFTVGNIEGGAEYALPDNDLTPLEGGEKLPPGATVCTYPESSVVLISDSGSAVQLNENTEMVIGVIPPDDKKDSLAETGKGASSPSSSTSSSKTLLDLYRGGLQYIFNAFSSSGAKDKNDSYFRIRTTSGVAAASGGSGFVDSDGNFGATGGRLAVLSETGKILRAEAGEGIRVREGGVLEHVAKVTDLPFGRRSLEAVLQLGAHAEKLGKLKAGENNLVKDAARKAGLSVDQIKEIVHREYAHRLTGEALRDFRERHREALKAMATRHTRRVIRKEHHAKALDQALQKEQTK